VILVGPGQAGDSPMLPPLLASLRIPRLGPGGLDPESWTRVMDYAAVGSVAV
jgi:hypothetical protein